MVTRAGVSESAFFETFPNIGECYRAAHEQGLERLSRAVGGAAGREAGWLGRVRAGLVALLGFFDDEPCWARLLVLEAPVGATVTLECRRRLHGPLVRLLDERGGGESGGAANRASSMPAPALTSELVTEGVLSVIAANMTGGDGVGRLVELAPALLAFIVASGVGPTATGAGPEGMASSAVERLAHDAGSARELERARAIARAGELPVRVTRRTTLVLRAIAQAPYSNNREVADAAGLVDEGQTSKLLARLERRGVIENVGIGAARGEPNAWLLTPSGRRALKLIGQSFASGAPRPRSTRARRIA